MSHPIRNRSHLLMGCGSAAMALALALAPQAVRAQGIQATGNVVLGSAEITDIAPNETNIDVFDPTVVIDWTPTEDVAGNALDFLPAGNIASFSASSLPNFAVLNRLLPSTNGNVAVINGSVISRVTDIATGASVPGGFVAFYSPTGILIGSTATFDVGRLMLTTLDTTNGNFQNFAEFGSPLNLTGATGSTARIQINPGAQILATPENSFFAVVAADVQMLGTARINGSHAYVAGEVVNLNFSNGLFNISVPVGTAAGGNVMRLDGNIGGPSSNGAGDNHMIYALAAAQADPISMIFRGNLGFDPAQSAGIVNGEIILSANYNVFGRNVDGGSISDGINAVFGANSATSATRADIFMEDFAASSSVLAIGTHRTQVTAFNAASLVAGNLLMVGRENAELTASNGQSFTIAGDVLVSAQDYGVVSSSLQNLDQINAAGGIAFIDAFGGGTMNIGGSALVAADAFAGADDLNRIAGTAQGGQALIGSTGGTLNITGNATASAGGFGTSVPDIQTGATVRGGLAQFFATQGGQVTLGGDLFVGADAIGSQGAQFTTSTVSNAYGGDAFVNIFGGGGTIDIGGAAVVTASAVGGQSNTAGAGSIGDAGQAIANINGSGVMTITGALQMEADGTGGDNAGGTGGVGLGGRASSAIFTGGTINVGLDFEANADGLGGDGQTGGDGFGGIAGANAVIGAINIGGSAFVSSAGLGGSAFFGFGGNGGLGRGGNAFLQANGTLIAAASVTVTGDATVFAQGVGGNGGQSDGQAIAGGRGGDAYGGQFTVPNQADPAFGSGAYILAGGDNGTISVGGDALALASGFAGSGGGASNPLLAGTGGNGFGGLAQVGLALLGQNGSLGDGSATFGILIAEAEGFGGNGGFTGNDFPDGIGGNGTGGDAFLTARAGDITADQIELRANGIGGDAALAGTGRGGQAALIGGLGGSLTANQLDILASGIGGFAATGTGGNAFGGLAAIEGDGISLTINGNATVDASASGGNSEDGASGNAAGGEAYVATVTTTTPGSIAITGHARVFANATGGNTLTSFVAGNANGGTAYIEALGGSTISMNSAQVHAVGRGGSAQTHQSGNGTGGAARIAASGANSRVTILRNVPTSFTQTSGGFVFVNANGIADTTNGGTGIGGTGRGGTADVTATAGGTLNLPTNIASDPDAAFGSLAIFARGFGGGSVVEGGAGGAAIGGNVTILADGGTIAMGTATPSTFSEGGSSLDPTRNITGGDVTGGTRTIRVVNGGQLTIESAGGGTGAQGGSGSGTGNGGNAVAGNVVFEVINATANLIGGAPLFNTSAGGNGQIGGNVSGGSITLNLNNAQINLLPDAAGVRTLGLSSNMQGGNGVTAGGNAQGSAVNITITGSTIAGGRLEVLNSASGGNASAANGVGGNAVGAIIDANITGSQLNLVGETLFASDANGGAGGTTGVGGNANSGAVDVDFASSTINIVADAQGVPGVLRLRSQAIGGAGASIGNAASDRAQLNLVGSTLTANTVYVESRALSNTTASGQTGSTALSRDARIGLSGVSGMTAGLIEINSFASSSQGGGATAGFASLQAESGAAATVTAPQINLLADAASLADSTAGIAGATQGGQALVAANGGNLTINGNVLAYARGIGATSPNLLSGAAARGGVAQFFARLGGSLTLNGNLDLDASAFGANGSLVNASSVSDAFGGSAVINVGASGGTIAISGDARAFANAQGGSSNNAGAGSLGDAGEAVATLVGTGVGAGLITVTGRLTLEAEGAGGDNAGGIGGTGRGGRASVFAQNGGTINLGSLDADTLAQGGRGLTGGDAFGGIAGAVATIGTINIQGRAFAGTEGVGGDASYGFGGTGGVGRGGNSAFQATGTLAQTARVFIGGDAIAFAQGVGGRGGAGNLATGAPAGRGGDGYGGQFTVPNQADPNFNSGAFILAGGDNGAITVVGDAVAVATGAGGAGGTGGGVAAGGRGGDAFGGLAQVGLALLGQNGSLGQGSATFGDVLAQTDAFAGNGGAASGVQGDGGNGTGGDSLLTARAGDITANQIELSAIGYGGRGALGGSGIGGAAVAFGSLGGTLTAGRFEARAEGFGGNSVGLGANGGEGRGGGAEFDYQDITVTINGDAFLFANGTGGTTVSGIGGNGSGGLAQIGVLGAVNGSGTITGTGLVHANGAGGGLDPSSTTGGTGGNGQGGTAAIRVQAGGLARFGAVQVIAHGAGGGSFAPPPAGFVGGNGEGGDAEISSTGAGSRVIVERNITQAFANSGFNNPFLSSQGFGGNTSGGSGTGGAGQGGSILIAARAGGSVALPATPLTDPDSVGLVRLVARGIGGGSTAEGGVGGQGRGGSGTFEVDGGTLTMGAAVFSVFGQGGSSLDTSRNISGGQAVGGNRLIRVFNSGTASVELVGGTSGGAGGNGSGTGDGGDAFAGRSRIELTNGTLNITGNLLVIDQTTGGNGNNGGDAFGGGEGGALSLVATDSVITMSPNAAGEAMLGMGGTSQGGNGAASGGNAFGAPVTVTLTNTTVTGGRFDISPFANGGNATNGAGGTATGTSALVQITGSTLNLVGETIVSADVRGGTGTTTGGNATAGIASVLINSSTLALAATANGNPGVLRLRSQAFAGNGVAAGSATSRQALLDLAATSRLTADQIYIDSLANADVGAGGAADSDIARLRASSAIIDADLIQITANAETATAGTSIAGWADLQSSQSTINAGELALSANAGGADPARRVNVTGLVTLVNTNGTINLTDLSVTALGDVLDADSDPVLASTSGGNINVGGLFQALVEGDIVLRTSGGGIIGGPRAATTSARVQIDAGRTIGIEGDASTTGGIGGDVVRLRSADIAIASGARIGADEVFITSLDETHTAVLGGSTEGDGFTLTAEEIARISARELSFVLPSLRGSNDPNQIDVLVRDLSITGSGGNGAELVSIFAGGDGADGIVRVEGTLSYINAGTEDLLEIEAQRLEVVTPGGIRMVGANSVPSGELEITARDIWVADSGIITQLQADRSFAGRDVLLAAAAPDSADPLGYIRAGGVTLNIRTSLLVRNTGVEFEGGGILVGNGGLSIVGTGSTQSSTASQLDVFAYGRRQAADGSFVLGADFFSEVNFNRVSPGSSLYFDVSAFNDCIINSGDCPQASLPEELPPEIFNSAVLEAPLQVGSEDPPMTSDEEEERFGMDFPEQPDAPLISEDPLLDDPVSSGADASLYSGGTSPEPRSEEQ